MFERPTFTGLKVTVVNRLIQEIRIDEFDLSLARMRIINPKRVDRIQGQMYLQGQLQPVVVRIHAGKYQVIDGFKRIYAATELVMETLQCYVLDVDLKQAKLLVLSYNRSHGSMEVWEEAMVLADLVKRHHLSQQSLSRLTGYSRSWVSRRLSLISKISGEVSNDIRMGVISSSHARALFKLPRGNQMEVARVINSWGLTSRQTDALVEAFLGARTADQQQQVLAHPEEVLANNNAAVVSPLSYDQRLSGYGNELLQATGYTLSTIRSILRIMHAKRIETLKKTEMVIIRPEIDKVGRYANELVKAIIDLQIPKTLQQDER